MISLELVNTIAFTYLATEVYLWYSPAHDPRVQAAGVGDSLSELLWRRRLPLSLLLLGNVGYFAYNGATNTAPELRSFNVAFAELVFSFDIVLWTSLFITSVGLALVYAIVKQQWFCDRKFAVSRRELAVAYVGMFCGVYGMAWVTSLHVLLGVHSRFLYKLYGAVVGFFFVCYFDVRQTIPLTLGAFTEHVAEAMLFVAPVIPLAAVAISTVLFVVVSIVENGLGMDPSFLNWPVYYSTLYGPFSLVYFRTKQSCRAQFQRNTSLV